MRHFSISAAYQSLADQLLLEILNGKYAPGEKLPSVRELARQSHVGVGAVERALERLRCSGLVRAQRGSGHFITTDKAEIQAQRDIYCVMRVMFLQQNLMSLGYAESAPARPPGGQ